MKLLITPAAAEELQDIAAWYAERANSALGSAFIDEFERTTTLLLANPASGATFSRRFQQFSLRRFPYRIIYRLVKVNDELGILAIPHHRRYPAAWRKHPSR
ncbi:type II toxin-antitoxin system RelE/ParE family toxin [Janthinobacterium psychrotolerans]|uniref:Plasmid stabilization system protein ParE n=1 Tax=Janthinobacterium psychrotolerans TaxID=1747903 RepID=A0A1A7BUY1_9BURK|nr:type II toxin-antitoxin system RelE/ParE family toxin [Janthinobacterium psychrotolerans]OBV37366.1 Plasmid stabilization system protein ParE [Janthinobacterium psychrotolerans]